MTMETLQIRLTKEQLKQIDERVKRGEYPSRSEAIRDFVRKAEFLELFERFFAIASKNPLTPTELARTRAKVWREEFEPLIQSKKTRKSR